MLRSGDKRLQVFFHTSNTEKFLHAATVCQRAGLTLRHFKSTTEPYDEDYSIGKQRLLTRAIAEILEAVGKGSLFFVEDTSLRIDALSNIECDVPGLTVKEWFAATAFEELDSQLLELGNNRLPTVKSDIALHIPHLARPVFIHGSTQGTVATNLPSFDANPQYPWLTPNTFNGWFIPDGATKPLGAMALDESWQFDFRTRALEHLLDRLEEYSAVLNIPNSAYSRARPLKVFQNQGTLFQDESPVLCVVGKTCAGKSTFGERA